MAKRKPVTKGIRFEVFKYDDIAKAFDKVGGICYNRKIGRKADYYE